MQERAKKINSLFTEKGYSLVSPTKITANVEIQTANMTYTDETQWTAASAGVNSYINNYCQKFKVSEVYHWLGSDGSLHYGILVASSGVVTLYYINVQIR